MDFNNEPVSISGLPEFSSVEYLPLDRRFAPIRLAVLLLIYLGLLVLVTVYLQLVPDVSEFQSFVISSGLVWLIFLLMICVAWFLYASTRAIHYALRQHDLILKSGLFWKKEVIQPLKRVQHVEVTRGPIDKRFGLANVKLFSAGTALSTFRIPGISLETASRIKQYALDYKEHTAGPQGSAEPEA